MHLIVNLAVPEPAFIAGALHVDRRHRLAIHRVQRGARRAIEVVWCNKVGLRGRIQILWYLARSGEINNGIKAIIKPLFLVYLPACRVVFDGPDEAIAAIRGIVGESVKLTSCIVWRNGRCANGLVGCHT